MMGQEKRAAKERDRAKRASSEHEERDFIVSASGALSAGAIITQHRGTLSIPFAASK